MPLPWGSGGRSGGRIKDIAHRAITLQQLRNLATFLQRLTKTGLLRNTTEFSRERGTYQQSIHWDDINLYQISDEVLKKVIPHVDPEGKTDPEGKDPRSWYSWVEFVAPEPQPAKIMFSHWWGGCFKEFLGAVDKLVVDRSLSVNTAIWICTFANCQFGEDFGAMLKDCPFIQALRTVELTVLIVDFQAGSLARTWCGLEVHYTVEHEMEFQFYTSAGRVGSSFVSGGPLVEAVKDWDIRRSEASEAAYRRQILNYIAREPELAGLKTKRDRHGKDIMVLDGMGRPLLRGGAQEEADLDAEVRINGEPEFLYESRLFRKKGKRFEDLNMMVRLSVMKHLDVGPRAKGCEVGSAARGITLSQFRVVCQKIAASCPWSPDNCPFWQEVTGTSGSVVNSLPFESLKLRDICCWVRHSTAGRQCSYMELVAPGPQVPRFFIEHVWSGKQTWSDRVDMIERFAAAQQVPDSTTIFFDVFSRNQHSGSQQQKYDLSSMRAGAIMEECEGMLLLGNPENMNRPWPWLAVTQAVKMGKGVFLGTTTGILACNRPFPDRAWVYGRIDNEVLNLLMAMDIRDMTSTDPAAKEMVLKYIKENPNSAPGSMQDGWTRFHHRLRRWCAGPILRDAAKANDAQKIKDVSATPGLPMHRDTFKGSLGQTPLHIAAASGSLEALCALLEAGMSPNIEDCLNEQPLHYAALAGQPQIVSALLTARADPWAENSFAETPLQVARQNPAAFLQVDTREVVSLLSVDKYK